MNTFDSVLAEHNIDLRKREIEVLQVNVGKLCNLTCVHCHVEAGPTKTRENMDRETVEAVVRFMDVCGATTLDITGGSPELNPHFKYLVREGRSRNMRVIDRCNLTIFFEKGMSGFPEFLAENQVEIVASLPCYQEQNVDKQRGKGAFQQSIKGLKWLNELGYGTRKDLSLNLVYNPVGPHLPPPQNILEEDYKRKLKDEYGIVFNKLFTITNMPITRYAKYLRAFQQFDDYMELLINSFNLATVEGLMCVNTLSVGWDGRLYDCDFNQMLGMEIRHGRGRTIRDMSPDELKNLAIQTGRHCFGCTAGAGSSCQGALKDAELTPSF